MEYELLDTGVFNGDRYFDVFVEVAKQSPEDLLIQISAINRGPASASLQVLPTLSSRIRIVTSAGIVLQTRFAATFPGPAPV